eukprot:1812182-Lingulodinium_polyedra.AAC.1
MEREALASLRLRLRQAPAAARRRALCGVGLRQGALGAGRPLPLLAGGRCPHAGVQDLPALPVAAVR